MYPWHLGRGLVVPLLAAGIGLIHDTRAEMMEAAVRRALAEAGPGATALDMACSEGWFAHRLLEWGAEHVTAIDVREGNIRRARLVRDHLGVDAERLVFEQRDAYDLDRKQMGQFDVVLVLGLIYHVEDPIGVLRRARGMTRRVCIVESQLTRQIAPITFGAGPGIVLASPRESFAAYIEPSTDTNPTASTDGILALIPNAPALETSMRVAGFSEVEFAPPQSHHAAAYHNGDRALVIAR